MFPDYWGGTNTVSLEPLSGRTLSIGVKDWCLYIFQYNINWQDLGSDFCQALRLANYFCYTIENKLKNGWKSKNCRQGQQNKIRCSFNKKINRLSNKFTHPAHPESTYKNQKTPDKATKAFDLSHEHEHLYELSMRRRNRIEPYKEKYEVTVTVDIHSYSYWHFLMTITLTGNLVLTKMFWEVLRGH